MNIASGFGIAAGPGGLAGQLLYFTAFTRAAVDDAPRLLRGSNLRLSGMLKPVSSRGGADSFNGYLRGLGVKYELSPAYLRAELSLPSAYARAREALAARMNSILSLGFQHRPDLVAIYHAMMLGRKDGLTSAQKALFVRSGTMHLFAINGLHIGIVAVASHALLTLLRVPRGLAQTVPVLLILWLDVDSTGAAPSALRAFIMVATVEIARAAALPINPLSAVTTAAAVLLALRPQDLFSASFQMSFAVVLTLILLGVPLAADLHHRADPYPLLPPPARNRWQRLRAATQLHVASTLGFSAAAAAISTLSGISFFTTLSLAALPANLLLMPLATLVIVAGFASIVCGILHVSPASVLFNHAAAVLLRMITSALESIAAHPAAAIAAHYRFARLGPLALTSFLALCFRGYCRGWSGGYREPFIAVALILFLGVSYGT